METYFDFAVDRFRRPQSTWVNRSLRLAFKVVLNFLEAHRDLSGEWGVQCMNIFRGAMK